MKDLPKINKDPNSTLFRPTPTREPPKYPLAVGDKHQQHCYSQGTNCYLVCCPRDQEEQTLCFPATQGWRADSGRTQTAGAPGEETDVRGLRGCSSVLFTLWFFISVGLQESSVHYFFLELVSFFVSHTWEPSRSFYLAVTVTDVSTNQLTQGPAMVTGAPSCSNQFPSWERHQRMCFPPNSTGGNRAQAEP